MGSYIIFLCFSYVLGSVPFGLILSRLKGLDPRKAGSGNIGATNVMRTAGKLYGILTLLFDTLKGFLPVYIAKYMGFPELIVLGSGLLSFIGHVFPFILRFKGGRGVATALGVFLCLNLYVTLLGVVIFALVVMILRYVSLGSIVASLSFPFLLYLFGESKKTISVAFIFAGIIILRHRDNIVRLLNRRENRLTF